MSITIAISSWVIWKRTLPTSLFHFTKEWLLQALPKDTGLKSPVLEEHCGHIYYAAQPIPASHGKIPAHLQLHSELNGSGKQINKQSNRAETLVCQA